MSMTDDEQVDEVHLLRLESLHLNNEDQRRPSFPLQESLTTSDKEDETNHTYEDNDQKTSPVISSFPQELHVLIFHFTLLPETLLNVSPHSGYSVAWAINQKIKLSILMVNKAWFQASVEFLYHHIVIWDTEQLSLLCRTIGDVQVPESHEAFNNEIVYLDTICHGIEWGHYLLGFYESFLNCAAGVLPSFTRAQLSGTHTPRVAPVLDFVRHSSPNLILLHLKFHNSIQFSDFTPPRQPLVFPNLETLQLEFGFKDSTLSPKIRTLTDIFVTMTAPKLVHVRLTGHPPSTFLQFSGPFIDAFLQHHGGQLKTLHLFEVYPDGILSTIVGPYTQTLLDLCPNLRHLVLGPRFIPEHEFEFHHSSLEFLDFWDYLDFAPPDLVDSDDGGRDVGPPCSLDVSIRISGSRSYLPKLKNVRRIDSRLRYLWELPFVLPPSAYATEDEKGLLLPIPGGPIQVSPCLLYYVEDDPGLENYLAFIDQA